MTLDPSARDLAVMRPAERALDPDFSFEVLEDLDTYRRKRRWVAWLLWTTLGLLGVHRSYLERPFTGVLQLFTGGGAVIWWLIDAAAVNRMVREHNEEQAERERTGRPPVEMAGMPPLDEKAPGETPEWVKTWSDRSVAPLAPAERRRAGPVRGRHRARGGRRRGR